jgi:predicted metal-dependent phosphoesterase TrpH
LSRHFEERGPRAQSAKSFIDLHCHTSASFDSVAAPRAVVRAAAARGLTHLAITDHERLDGAFEARDHAPDGLTIIVGEEIRTAEGDLIALFLERAIPRGMSARETIDAVRAQGALVGIPHPFDRLRGSLMRDARMAWLAEHADWVEAHNARLVGSGNETAAEFARANRLPGVAVSEAHSVMEVGVAYTVLYGDPSKPAGLLAALATTGEIVPGRASLAVRAVTPIAKLVQRARGNGRPPSRQSGSGAGAR